MGESGSGKSTLLHLIAGLDEADDGEIWLNRVLVTALSDFNRAALRRETLGIVFQQFNLIPDGEHMAFSFNLCSTAFIHYMFADPGKLVQGRASPEFLAQAIASWENRPQVQLNVTHVRNDRALLARYNRHVIEQCYERVYCSAKDGLVLSDPGLIEEPAAQHPQPYLAG